MSDNDKFETSASGDDPKPLPVHEQVEGSEQAEGSQQVEGSKQVEGAELIGAAELAEAHLFGQTPAVSHHTASSANGDDSATLDTSLHSASAAAGGSVDVSSEAAETEIVAAHAHAPEQGYQAFVPEQTPQQLPGATLAKRRKEYRLSVEDVSARLKISTRQIIALESDDFAQLASMATVRGFIRSYAKLLELDPAPLIAMLSSEPNPAFDSMVVRRPLPAPGLRGRQAPPPRRRNPSKWPSVIMVVAVVSALVFAAYQYGWFSVPSVDVDKVINALPPLTGGRDTPTSDAESDKSGAGADLGAAAAAGSALEIKAREDSWVEVTTVEGDRRLISRLMKAGTTELVEVHEPVVLVVGNAAGVDAALRGQSLNLRAVARDNVAKLSLK